MRLWLPVAAGLGVVVALGAAAALAIGPDPVTQPRRVPKPGPVPVVPAPGGSPDVWVRLVSGAGLRVVRPKRAYTTAAVESVLAQAAAVALAAGGALQVAEVAGEVRGQFLPPHKSHRWGRDVDVGYTLTNEYPTPITTAIDPRWVSVLLAIRPWIETVGVCRARALELAPGAPLAASASELGAFASEASGLPISVWPGHVGHGHVRLVAALAPEVLA